MTTSTQAFLPLFSHKLSSKSSILYGVHQCRFLEHIAQVLENFLDNFHLQLLGACLFSCNSYLLHSPCSSKIFKLEALIQVIRIQLKEMTHKQHRRLLELPPMELSILLSGAWKRSLTAKSAFRFACSCPLKLIKYLGKRAFYSGMSHVSLTANI